MSEIDKILHWMWENGSVEKITSNGQEFFLTRPNIEEAKHKILSLILSGRPKKRELDMMTYGGCNPDFQYGYNTCLDEYDNWIKEILK